MYPGLSSHAAHAHCAQVINLLLVGPVIKETPDTSRALRAHAAGSLAAAVGGGYSNYLAVSNTAIHIKCGGRTKGSCNSSSKISVAQIGPIR